MAAVAWGAGRRVESPAQRAAKRRPPARTVLTAPVVRQRLDREVALRLHAVPIERTKISTYPTVEGSLPVVTEPPLVVGSMVLEGQRLVAVSNRPLIILGGALDAYRDLKPGDAGPDVRQLEDSLSRLGLLRQMPDDSYGPGTKGGIRSLYQRAGYTAPEFVPDGSSETELLGRVQDAVAALAEARKGTDLTAIKAADHSLATARTGLAKYQVAAGPILPQSEVVFVHGLPLFIEQSRAMLGRKLPEGAYLTLRTKALIYNGSLVPSLAAAVRPGQSAVISSDSGASRINGVVVSVAHALSKDGSIAIKLAPRSEIPPDLADHEVRGVVKTAANAKSVLAVPVSALVTRPDGSTVVVRRDRGGKEVALHVRVGAEANGFVEVRPLNHALRIGDTVVVGR